MIWLVGNRGMLGAEVEDILRQGQVSYIASDKEVDITNAEQLQRFAKPRAIDWIINCAAYTAVDKAEEEPIIAFKINGEGVKNLAELAKNKKSRLIHISTDYVFDGTKIGEYTESDTPNPLGVYGKSKLLGEKNIQETIDEFFIIRISWLYGRYGANFVHTMQRLFREREEIGVVADQLGSPTSAVDIAQLLVKIVGDDSKKYGIYHFSNEGVTSWYDFACEIYRLSREIEGKEVAIKRLASVDYPTKAQRPKNSAMSKKKIRKEIGAEIRPWKQSLSDYLLSNSSSY
ncbi:MAG: dTDP-4-dehydrorhamnose reductase [Deltaproteobacteria bacterium]|nr:dTDP-4-dehydrorhamnose reductase [Deltaproteobacteria bacterium]